MIVSDVSVKVQINPEDWKLPSTMLRSEDLRMLRKKMVEYRDKVDDHVRYVCRAMLDENLPDATLEAMDSAAERMTYILDYLEDGIEAIDDALEAWRKLEENLQFVYYDVAAHAAKL